MLSCKQVTLQEKAVRPLFAPRSTQERGGHQGCAEPGPCAKEAGGAGAMWIPKGQGDGEAVALPWLGCGALLHRAAKAPWLSCRLAMDANVCLWWASL